MAAKIECAGCNRDKERDPNRREVRWRKIRLNAAGLCGACRDATAELLAQRAARVQVHARLRASQNAAIKAKRSNLMAVVLETAQMELLQSLLRDAESVAYEQGDTDRAVALDSLLAAVERAKGAK